MCSLVFVGAGCTILHTLPTAVAEKEDQALTRMEISKNLN